MDRAQETRELDSTLERMFKNLPSDPYVVTIPSNPQYHRPSDERYKWREHTCFDLDEEHLQYASFRLHQDPESMLLLQPQPSQKKPQSSAPLTPSTAAKKKISLADYAKSKQSGTPLPFERDSKKDEHKSTIKDRVTKPEHEPIQRQDDRVASQIADVEGRLTDDKKAQPKSEGPHLKAEQYGETDSGSSASKEEKRVSGSPRKRNFAELIEGRDPVPDKSDVVLPANKKVKADEDMKVAKLAQKDVQATTEESKSASSVVQNDATKDPAKFSAQPLKPPQKSNIQKKQISTIPRKSSPLQESKRATGLSNGNVSPKAIGNPQSPKKSPPVVYNEDGREPLLALWAPNWPEGSSRAVSMSQNLGVSVSDTSSTTEFLQTSAFGFISAQTSSSTVLPITLPSEKGMKKTKSAFNLEPGHVKLSSKGKSGQDNGDTGPVNATKGPSNVSGLTKVAQKKHTAEVRRGESKKRPNLDDGLEESAPKRQRADTPMVGKAPSTPLGAASSPAANVTPSSSVTKKHLTPGVKTATGGLQSSAASTPQGFGRTPNGDANEPSHSRSTSATMGGTKSADTWRKENSRLEGLGKKLKKQFESILKSAEETKDRKKSAQLAKLAAILGLESIVCFMEAFCALDQFKPSFVSWRSLGSMMDQVIGKASSYPHVLGILRLLQSTQCSTMVALLGKTNPESIQSVEKRLEHLSMVQRYSVRAQHFAIESEQNLTKKCLPEVYPNTYRESLNVSIGTSGKAMPVLRLATKFMAEWSKHEGIKWSQQLDEGMCSRI